ncbi:alcohol dehydrogenase, catalytic domain, GroES-like family [Gorgonomyces haynaldii]|nr:alcohol dehydrogenase, catalytic domain, GroES-like family [Gorgonomyces haynaldii]
MFRAYEMHADGSLQQQQFEYIQVDNGVQVWRNGILQSHFVGDYVICETVACGICSTDIARPFLPFPLPQIVGHEIVVRHNQELAVVEINDGHWSHNQPSKCHFCYGSNTMRTQCPERLTIGINQLPGGFAPKTIVPRNNLISLPSTISWKLGCLIEPFAAALHGVITSAPNDTVLVLGAGRLGMLTIAALDLYRNEHKLNLKITASTSHTEYHALLKDLGADSLEIDGVYDTVIDTTGSPNGLERALSLAIRQVHLKSTHGQPMLGMTHWTEMVVDEISIIPLDQLNRKSTCFLMPSLTHLQPRLLQEFDITVLDPVKAFESGKRFDVAFCQTMKEADQLLRPTKKEESLLRPRGSLCFLETKEMQKRITTSRCGDFKTAIQMLDKTRNERLEALVTHIYSMDELETAFQAAKRQLGSCIKVIVTPQHHSP